MLISKVYHSRIGCNKKRDGYIIIDLKFFSLDFHENRGCKIGHCISRNCGGVVSQLVPILKE